MLYVSILNHSYWVLGSTFGGLLGSFIPSDVVGIDFSMTALFVVIVLEQVLSGVKNIPSVVIGVGFSVVSLFVFGGSDFIIPAMVMIFLALTAFRAPIEKLADGGLLK